MSAYRRSSRSWSVSGVGPASIRWRASSGDVLAYLQVPRSFKVGGRQAGSHRDADGDNGDVVSWSASLEFQYFAEDGAGQCFRGVEGARCRGGEPCLSVEVFSAASLGDAVGVEQKRVTRWQADVHIVQMRGVYDAEERSWFPDSAECPVGLSQERKRMSRTADRAGPLAVSLPQSQQGRRCRIVWWRVAVARR